MLKVLLLSFILSSVAYAQKFEFDLTVNPEKYDLNIRLTYGSQVTLNDVIRRFKNTTFLANLSDSIESVIRDPTTKLQYDLVMNVRSMGIGSKLVSKCNEDIQDNSWSRTCELQTDVADGGKYMNWKKDQIVCANNENTLGCVAHIQGQSRPLKIFGWQLMNHQNFSLRAKVPALQNFAEIWQATNSFTWNVEEIKNHQQVLHLKKQFDQMLDSGLASLKTSETFQFSGESQEPKRSE